MNDDQAALQLPNGSTLQVRLPNSPNRNIRDHMRGMCKFHIPLSKIDQQADRGLWPVLAVLQQPQGKNSIPENELWKGSERDWRTHLRTQEVGKINKRARKLRALRKSRTALAKLSNEEWEALKVIFLIQPQFS